MSERSSIGLTRSSFLRPGYPLRAVMALSCNPRLVSTLVGRTLESSFYGFTVMYVLRSREIT